MIKDKGSIPSLYKGKRASTQQELRKQAIRLFIRKGYDNTTVQEIADAANVSAMTFFRYFPTKEDVLVNDGYDDLAASIIKDMPTDWPLHIRLERTITQTVLAICQTDQPIILASMRLARTTPALHAKIWKSNNATIERLVASLSLESTDSKMRHKIRCLAAAYFAVAVTAAFNWAENDGKEDLLENIEEAFASVKQEWQV